MLEFFQEIANSAKTPAPMDFNYGDWQAWIEDKVKYVGKVVAFADEKSGRQRTALPFGCLPQNHDFYLCSPSGKSS